MVDPYREYIYIYREYEYPYRMVDGWPMTILQGTEPRRQQRAQRPKDQRRQGRQEEVFHEDGEAGAHQDRVVAQ